MKSKVHVKINNISAQLQKLMNDDEIISFLAMARGTSMVQENGSLEFLNQFMFNTEHPLIPNDNKKRINCIDYELYAYYHNVAGCLINKFKQVHCIKDDKKALKMFFTMMNSSPENAPKSWFKER